MSMDETDPISFPHVETRHDSVRLRLMKGASNYYGFDERIELLAILRQYLDGSTPTHTDFADKLHLALLTPNERKETMDSAGRS
jgi:hypothetical protein